MKQTKQKYWICFTAHDAQGKYCGYISKVFKNKLTGRKQINARLSSAYAHPYPNEKSAQKVVDGIKAHEKDYDTFFPIEELVIVKAF